MVARPAPFTLRSMDIAKRRSKALAVAALAGFAMALAACSSSGKHTVSATPTTAASVAGTTVGGGTLAAGGTCGGGAGATGNGPEASPPGDIPDNQAYVTYQPPAGRYSV